MPDARGERRCSYCGVVYRLRDGVAERVGVHMVVQQTNARVTLLLVVVGVVVLLSSVVVYLLLVRDQEPASPPSASAPATRTEVATPPAVPSTTAKKNPSVVVDAPPADPETPPVPATATFEFHRNKPGYKTSYYALGYVTNTSPFPIAKPEVVAVLLDEQGNEVGTHNGFAEADLLQPGERAPISLLINDPKPHASVTFEVVPRRATWAPELVEGLRLEVAEPQKAAFGDRLEFSGKVFNEGNTPAQFVRIQILGFDANDKLVGVASTYAKAERLGPGESARWSSPPVDFAEHPARFEYGVSGRVAK